ncbi:hypothetical protein BGX20_005090 [Mortierella sp. AD010]|nr:hypothetical protein BGX20_005090 [Mortierella sp. AD010]
MPIYGKSEYWMCRIITTFVKRVVSQWGAVLEWDHHRLNHVKLEGLAEACAEKSGGLCNDAFISTDDIVHEICQPSHHQQSMLNGMKHTHGIKRQVGVMPDRIIIHHGPEAHTAV